MDRLRPPFAAVVLASLTTLPAFAHSRPKVMVPAADAVVAEPSEISVIFSEGLEPKFSSLKLMDEKGAVVSKEDSKVDSADPKHMTLALPRLAPGVYVVHWVTAAPDGHRMNGEYQVTFK